jgi:glycosyltransferase involved in cell wall biosynthesis
MAERNRGPLKILLLYDYPAPPGGLATQGQLLYRGLKEIGVDAFATHIDSMIEKEWYYRWLKPDIVLGVGYWGKTPEILLHPQQFGMNAIPWLVADGYIANYQQVLNSLPLILVTSNWVKEVYVRDGIRKELIEILPVGCDTTEFRPRAQNDPKVVAVRESFQIHPDQLMILTVGGDGASKGAQEVMQALATLMQPGGFSEGTEDQPNHEGLPGWKYVCKVWPQERTRRQNEIDRKLAKELGISDQVIYSMDRVSRDFMPYLYAACDIYAAPSRLEGFGMPQVEAGACEKPVVSIAAMGMLDTLIHGRTALLASVAEEHYIHEATLGAESGFPEGRTVEFNPPRIADYRADVGDLQRFFGALMSSPDLRRRLGEAGRRHIMEHFDYRTVARRFLDIISERFGIT